MLKPKKCKNCNEKFQPQRPLQQVCSTKCATEYKKKLQLKQWNKERREWHQKNRTSKELRGDLQEEINGIVRLIDKGHPCISSGKENYTVNAGHLYSVGAFPVLRFHLMNIFNQSVTDNWYKGGNGVIYKERIKEIFGEAILEEIEGLKAKYKRLDLRTPELKEYIEIARRIRRSLEKADLTYTTEQRVLLRRKFNQEIGIYK